MSNTNRENSNFIQWIKHHELAGIGLATLLVFALTKFSGRVYDNVYNPLFEKHIRQFTCQNDKKLATGQLISKDFEQQSNEQQHNIGITFLWYVLELAIVIFIVYLVTRYLFHVDIRKSVIMSAPIRLVNGNEDFFKIQNKAEPIFTKNDSWCNSVVDVT